MKLWKQIVITNKDSAVLCHYIGVGIIGMRNWSLMMVSGDDIAMRSGDH